MYILRRMRVERAFSRFRRRVSSAFSSGVRCLRLPYFPRDRRGRPSSLRGRKKNVFSYKHFSRRSITGDVVWRDSSARPGGK